MSTWSTFIRLYGNAVRNGGYAVQEISSAIFPQISKQKQQMESAARGAAEKILKSETARRLRVAYIYCSAECGPPKMSEVQEFKNSLVDVKNWMKRWKELTVRELWLVILVSLEIVFWFYIGEVIGKLHIVGYKV